MKQEQSIYTHCPLSFQILIQLPFECFNWTCLQCITFQILKTCYIRIIFLSLLLNLLPITLIPSPWVLDILHEWIMIRCQPCLNLSWSLCNLLCSKENNISFPHIHDIQAPYSLNQFGKLLLYPLQSLCIFPKRVMPRTEQNTTSGWTSALKAKETTDTGI